MRSTVIMHDFKKFSFIESYGWWVSNWALYHKSGRQPCSYQNCI